MKGIMALAICSLLFLFSCEGAREFAYFYIESGDVENAILEGAENIQTVDYSWNEIGGTITSADDSDYFVFALPADANSIDLDFLFNNNDASVDYSFFHFHLVEYTAGELAYHYFSAVTDYIVFDQSSPDYLYMVVLGCNDFPSGSYKLQFRIRK